MIDYGAQYGAVIDYAEQIGVQRGVQPDAVVGIHNAEVPFCVHSPVRVGIAPDLDIVAGPVGTAKVYLCAEKVDQPVDVDLAGNVQVV